MTGHCTYTAAEEGARELHAAASFRLYQRHRDPSLHISLVRAGESECRGRTGPEVICIVCFISSLATAAQSYRFTSST